MQKQSIKNKRITGLIMPAGQTGTDQIPLQRPGIFPHSPKRAPGGEKYPNIIEMKE